MDKVDKSFLEIVCNFYLSLSEDEKVVSWEKFLELKKEIAKRKRENEEEEQCRK